MRLRHRRKHQAKEKDMTVRVRVGALALTALVALFGLGMFMLSPARGSGEPENPFWSVAGRHLESGSKKATVRNVSEVETIIHGTLASKEVEVRCKTGVMKEAAIEGAATRHDGKVTGVLELSECRLWAVEGETFKEQKGCEVSTITSTRLLGALWLEGTKAAAGTTTILVFEPKELTEGKPKIGNVVITNREACTTFAGTHVLEGSFAARLLPQNEEFTYMRWVLPSTAITKAWKPASEEGETTIGLKLEGGTSRLQGELQAEPESKESFGGGVAPVAGIEAPFWGVKGRRLESGEEAKVQSGAISEVAVLKGHLKGTEIEIRCKRVVFKEAKLLGSLGQHDGKFDAILEFSECTLFAKEGETFKEQKGCEVPTFSTSSLTGRLWFEGTKAERRTKTILILESESGIFAEPTIKTKTGESCSFAEKWVIHGSIDLNMKPEEEVETIDFKDSGLEKQIGWQSAEQEAEREAELWTEEEVTTCSGKVKERHNVTFKLPETPVTLVGGGKFRFTHE
jgi:hypothetical protein